MTVNTPFRAILVVAIASLAVGCGGADNPKIPEAPAFVPSAEDKAAAAAPKLPGQKTPYGANKKYQESMGNVYNLK